MAMLTRERLETLLQARTGPCISIYLPTHRHHPGTEQAPIRFKNALKEAERLLSDRHSPNEIHSLLQPVASLASTSFWRHQADGLALFRSQDLLEEFRLPMTVPDLVVVAGSFHVRPLVRCLNSNGRYFVLALTQNAVAVFEGSMTSLTRSELPGLPVSLSEFTSSKRRRAALSQRASARAGRGRRVHVAGGPEPAIEDDLLPFFRAIDRVLQRALRGDGAPILLAAVEYYLPIYRGITRLKNLADAVIAGSPDALTEEELRARAWPVAQSLFRRSEEDALDRFRRAAERGRSCQDLREIVRLARLGRVRRLILPHEVRIWGTVDPRGGEIHKTAEQQGSLDDDILDDVAESVLRSGGEVISIPPQQMPNGQEVAAELR